jgi:hypothetical protein
MNAFRRNSILVSSAIALMVAWAFSGAAGTPDPSEVESVGIGGINGMSGALDVQFMPLKDSYKVHEPIRFNVRGNMPFYLYLYTTDSDSQETKVILPRRLGADNGFPAERTLIVPAREADFTADAPGTKLVTMVASTKHLDIRTGVAEAPADAGSGLVKSFQAALDAKVVRIESGRTRIGDDQLVAQKVSIRIRDAENSDRNNAIDDNKDDQNVIVFLSTAKNRYRDGEHLRVLFGADREGWVHFYVVEPENAYYPVVTRRVDGREIETATVRAESPFGRHLLVAAYSEGKDFDEDRIDAIARDRRSKGLSLVGEERQGWIATLPIEIVE